MWQGRAGIAALVVVAAVVAMPLYLPTSNGAGNNQLEVYSWWTGPGEEEGLDAMVGRLPAQAPGDPVCQRRRIRWRRLQRQGDPGDPAAGQRPAGLLPAPRRPGTRRRRALGQGAGPQRPVPAAGLDGRVPRRAARTPDHRRQDLRGAGEHPPRQPASGTARGRCASWASSGPPKTWTEFLQQAERDQGQGQGGPADRRARSGRRSSCWRRCCSASSAPTATSSCGPGQTSGHAPTTVAALDSLREGAGRLRHEVRRGGLAAAAGPGRLRLGGVRRDGRLGLLVPASRPRAGWQRGLRRAPRRPAATGSTTSSPTRSPCRSAPAAPTLPGSGSSSAARPRGRTCSTRSRARSRPGPTPTPASYTGYLAGRCSSGATRRPASSGR